MQLMYELLYYLDLQTGQVILELDEAYTGEPGIDWDDEENNERHIGIPKITSNEEYLVMMQFAKRTKSDPDMKLFDALDGYKPFRRFKHVLSELDAWDEFERLYAEEKIKAWLERFELAYEQLAELYKSCHP